MAARNKTYYLAPSWDITPDEVVLGSIVADFQDPQRFLSASTLPTKIDTAIVGPLPSTKCSGVAKKSREWMVGLFATFIHFVTLGGKLSFSRDTISDVEYSCDLMETRRFMPSENYIKEAASDSGVNGHLQTAGLGAKVFMITGIKTAQNITITTKEEVGHGEEASVGVDLPIAQTTVGPKGSHKSRRVENHSQTIAGPIVFAMQVEKMRLRRSGEIKHEKQVIGATLERKAGAADDYVVVTEGGSLDDEEVGDFGVSVKAGVEDDGEGDSEDCVIVIPGA